MFPLFLTGISWMLPLKRRDLSITRYSYPGIVINYLWLPWSLYPIRIYTFFFFFLIATPVVYGSSWARGQIRTTAAGLHHSHSYAGSKPHLQHWVLNPRMEARDQTLILTGTVSDSKPTESQWGLLCHFFKN